MRQPWDPEVELTGRSGYSVLVPADKDARDNIALALGKELDISPKHAVELCSALRGKKVDLAKAYLERVMEKRQAVPFRRFNSKVGHRKGPGLGPGRYPVKAAAAILKILEQAEANAEFLQLDPESLRIIHMAASRGQITEGHMARARGRSSASNHESVNVEVMVSEEPEEDL